MSKEHPILFNAKMVKAILEGIKTQTRRVIKPLLNKNIEWDFIYRTKDHDAFIFRDRMRLAEDLLIRCPYGKPGDRLLIRLPLKENCPCCGYTIKDKEMQGDHYLCSVNKIILEITDIKVEKLQGISDKDACWEGVDRKFLPYDASGSEKQYIYDGTAKKLFIKQWDSIYAKKHPWSSNPWVWVIEFKKNKGAQHG